MKKGLNRIREIERQNYANYRKFCEEQFLRRHIELRQEQLRAQGAPEAMIDDCRSNIEYYCGLGA